jgi:hypothetical protein
MHEDHEVSRRARRKDTLSAEDLGILLQWRWKYGTSTFANERQRIQMSLLILFSAFTGSRPGTLLADDDDDNSSSSGEIMPQQISELVARVGNSSRESLVDESSGSTLVDNSDGDTLVGTESDSKARTTRLRTICYGDIDLFLLRNLDNPERDILIAKVDFRNLKGRSEGVDG